MITRLKPYPKMKHSGLFWLGDIPEHWKVRRLKYLLREVDDRSTTGSEQLLRVSQYTGVTERSNSETGEPDTRSDSLVGYKRVEPGDLVVNIMLAWNGSLGVSEFHGITSTAYCVYRVNAAGLNPWYVHHLLRTDEYKTRIKMTSRGVVDSRLRLYTDDLYDVEALVPPENEQHELLRFLNHADRLIKRYIRAKQKLIKLLEEQKQAVIHRAVTRGLDPTVHLKPSGFDRLGDIPKHWDVAPFKHRVCFQEGPGIMASDFREHGIPLLRISGLKDDIATLHGCNYLDPDAVNQRWSHFRVREGDYLLSASASTGKVSIATKEVAGSIPYTGIIRLWPASAGVVMPFVRLFIESASFQVQVDVLKSGVAIEHFGPSHLKRMVIVLPPPEEQHAIVNAVEHVVGPINRAVEAAQNAMSTLRDLGSRLIADVVTGKIDVREAIARLPEETHAAEPLDEDDVILEDEESAS
jgi:type I restriction enzyme S subunit